MHTHAPTNLSQVLDAARAQHASALWDLACAPRTPHMRPRHARVGGAFEIRSTLGVFEARVRVSISLRSGGQTPDQNRCARVRSETVRMVEEVVPRACVCRRGLFAAAAPTLLHSYRAHSESRARFNLYVQKFSCTYVKGEGTSCAALSATTGGRNDDARVVASPR